MNFYSIQCIMKLVFYIPSPEARGYKAHNSFHNTSYGMKIHLRSYMYVLSPMCFETSSLNLE